MINIEEPASFAEILSKFKSIGIRSYNFTNASLSAYEPTNLILLTIISIVFLRYLFQFVSMFIHGISNMKHNAMTILFYIAANTPWGKSYIKKEEDKLRAKYAAQFKSFRKNSTYKLSD